MKVTAVYTVLLPIEIPDDADLPASRGILAGDIWNEIVASHSTEWAQLPETCELNCVFDTNTDKTLWQ